MKKAGKLLPKKEGWLDNFKPKQAQTFSAARNAPREKGFGGGGAWMKIDPKTPGAQAVPTLSCVVLAAQSGLRWSCKIL